MRPMKQSMIGAIQAKLMLLRLRRHQSRKNLGRPRKTSPPPFVHIFVLVRHNFPSSLSFQKARQWGCVRPPKCRPKYKHMSEQNAPHRLRGMRKTWELTQPELMKLLGSKSGSNLSRV